jgi:hypothetical protein
VCVVFAAGILGWTQATIRDIDNPFDGYWCLSPASFEDISQRIAQRSPPQAQPPAAPAA